MQGIVEEKNSPLKTMCSFSMQKKKEMLFNKMEDGFALMSAPPDETKNKLFQEKWKNKILKSSSQNIVFQTYLSFQQ